MQLPLLKSSTSTCQGCPKRGRNLRFDMGSLFVGTSDTAPPYGRKTPRLGLRAMASARLDSPHRHHINSRGGSGWNLGGIEQSGTSLLYGPRTNSAPARPLEARATSGRIHIGFGPEDNHLAALAYDGRQHRKQRRLNRQHRHPQRNRCFPRMTNTLVRRKLFSCLLSGILLATILTICSSQTHLSASNHP